MLSKQDVELISRIKFKDQYSDELLAKYQRDSDSLTAYEYGQLRMWVNEWLNYNAPKVEQVLSSTPTEMSLKYSNPTLDRKYERTKAIYGSFDYSVGSSTSEALALASLNTSAGLLTKGIEKLPQLGKIAEKYPFLTEVVATGIANTGYQFYQGGEYDPYSLLQSELSTVLTRGIPLGQQVSINIGISTLATENMVGMR